MPELPEVEVVRRGLAAEVTGKTIARVDVTGLRSVRRHAAPGEFVERVSGATFTDVGRHGKFLVLRLDTGDALVVHLGMSGQLRRATSSDEPLAKHTHVVFTFAGGDQLRFVDPRTFGQMFVARFDEVSGVVESLAHLGVDALVALATPDARDALAKRVTARSTKLKPLLMDQTFVAGLGNIYSDEVLHTAGLRWDRAGESLTPEEVDALLDAIATTLADAVECGGSSLADAQYVDLFGRAGRFQERHRVYAREDEPCTRCGRPIVRTRFANRSTFYCEHCQR
jgi:formamidopyrimidine-DNA glycosylase